MSQLFNPAKQKQLQYKNVDTQISEYGCVLPPLPKKGLEWLFLHFYGTDRKDFIFVWSPDTAISGKIFVSELKVPEQQLVSVTVFILPSLF
jgi:hypothetical protein